MFRIGDFVEPASPLSRDGLANEPSKGMGDSDDALSSDQKGETGLPEEVLNIIHDMVQALVEIPKIEGKLKTAMRSLKKELDREIMSNNLNIPQVVDLLRERISKETTNSYRKEAEIQMMEALLKKYTPSPQEALQIVDVLSGQIGKGPLHVRKTAMHVTEELLEQHIFPNQESLDPEQLNQVVRQILHQLERNLFQTAMFIREPAKQMMIDLLSRSIVSHSEKQKIFSRIAKQADKVGWQRRVTALQCLHGILSHGLLLDPEEGDQVARQSMEWLNDGNWGVRKQAIKILREVLKQDILYDSVELEVSLEVTKLIFDEEGAVGILAFKLVKSFLKGDNPLPGKLEVRDLVVEKLPHASNGKRKAINVLSWAAHNGVPLSLDAFDVAVDLVSEPFPLGTGAENLIRSFLKGNNDISETERMQVFLEMKKQVSNREVLSQLGSEEGGQAVREFLKGTEIFNGESFEIEVSEIIGPVEELVSSEDSLSEPQPKGSAACHQVMKTVLVIETL